MSIMKYLHRQTVVKAFVLACLWGVCIYFVVRLTSEYEETGRKNTVSLEVQRFEQLELPNFVIFSGAGSLCHFEPVECVFAGENVTKVNCIPAVMEKNYNGEASLLNATTGSSLGVAFKTPFDILHLTFSLVHRGNLSAATPEECGLLSAGPDTELSQFVVPVSDRDIIIALGLGKNEESLSLKGLGIPSYVGFGQIAHFTFSLEQELFIGDSDAENTTAFGLSQFPKYHKRDAFEIRISAASFLIRRIVHKKGQSLLDLMGGIFGWVGVFTGACIHSLFSTAVDVATRAKGEQEKQKRKMLEKQEESMLSPTPSLCASPQEAQYFQI